ncbi:Aluminum-activated malate transporter 1 [Perkinsus chesapeaki]|uniref:Aluminum-activated malate transporter 1 n=1 Tax=Perkinsus chesapeaki TaxID=330153 RepID=A0A7J6MGT8_PERCH|nr:Aluminum-activated malate transporter 1 [Perkinsus chesapeaki]
MREHQNQLDFRQRQWILGLVIAIISSQLTLPSAFEWTMKTVIASWYGAGYGCAIVAFVTAVNHNTYNPYIGVAVSIPFAIFVCLAEQANVSHCKFSAIYRGDKALLLIMLVVVFGGDRPYWAALTACIAYTTGTTITLLGTFILWTLHLLPRPGPDPMALLGHRMAQFFEEISSVAPVGEIQQQELDQKWKNLDKAAAGAAKTPDPHLRAIIFSMVSSLSTLARSLKHAAFSEISLKELWEPVDHTLNIIRVEVVSRLRPSPDNRTLKLDLYDLARTLRRNATDTLATYTVQVETGAMKPISESELARFDFCTREIANYVQLVADFLFRINNPPSSMHTSRAYIELKVKKWLEAPVFKPLNPPTPWLIRLAYPIRSGIGACIAGWIILGIGEALEPVKEYGLWMMLPCVFCFLPTPGASLVKGTRRVLGTICAGILAIICVSIHPYNKPAFFVELFVVSFLGKLLKCSPKVDYAGLVFAFTWVIVGLAAGTDGHLDESEMVLRSVYRAILTTCGVILATIISTLVFPEFAYGRLRRATARAIEKQGEMVANAVKQIQDSEPADSSGNGALDDKIIAAGDELLELRGERWSQVTDATVETKLFSCLRGMFKSDERRVNAAHIIACQPFLDRLNRRTMVVVTAAGSFHPSSDEPLPEVTDALTGLTPFISDMNDAGKELAKITNKHGSHLGLWDARSRKFDEAQAALTDVESSMQTAMRESRRRRARSDVDEAKEEDLSDVYAILRALSLFMEAWTDVEHMMYFGYVKDTTTASPFAFDDDRETRPREMKRLPTTGVARLRAYSTLGSPHSPQDSATMSGSPARSDGRST